MSQPTPLRIALTPGEPAGIGPDIVVRLAQRAWPCEIVAVADPRLLQERAALLDLRLGLDNVDYDQPAQPGRLRVDPVALHSNVTPGQPDPANAGYVLATLERAVALCCSGRCDALVT
ncbi:MAG: 4-hydroxythreonine-4-phosphate dehydrogenase PdxA, partial [Salinisphaera sp.]|nr:4-hydroxythreonine-4-phosphate dehydrogenase PdxA [Salinisphaera sp.]